ncbi:MAG TPA: BlaI/MecI/CopY family transcriptional regulator [Terriglobales bacterium]
MWWLKQQNMGSASALGELGSLESALMKRIWKLGEISVRDLHAEVSSRLAYTTIMTTLDRLFKKGLLKRRKEGKAYRYAAAISEEAYQESMAQQLIGIALENSSQAVLSRFVDAVSESDQHMLNRLDQLVRAKRRALRRTEAP